MGAVVLAWLAWCRGASATIAPASPDCAGNICSGQVSVGGQTVKYYYTEHVKPSGLFKIRFDGGVYNTDKLISFLLFMTKDTTNFSSWGKYSNPSAKLTPQAQDIPTEAVNPGLTSYERRYTSGCSGCRVDQVMYVGFSGLPDDPAGYEFNFSIFQNGDSGGKNNLKFYVDAGAPMNDDESTKWVDGSGNAVINGLDEPCADHIPPNSGGVPIDNDLNFLPNCADPKCDGQVGEVGTDHICEIPEKTRCWDDFDNDGDGMIDCADDSCDGQVGRKADGVIDAAYCQYGNEYGSLNSLNNTSPCDDGFDNDRDGRKDCYDNKLWTAPDAYTYFTTPVAAIGETKICWRHPLYGCPLTETSCTDGVDNDVDEAYGDGSYPTAEVAACEAGGPGPCSSGADCRDYDCAGNPACPYEEDKTPTGQPADAQCFNFDDKGRPVDDDLDHKANCADPDCIGVTWGGMTCYDKEFDLGQRINLCANKFDDDGDGPADCADSDCKGKFGNCGPCPSREDYLYGACSDSKDNDVNGYTDCADNKCIGKLGSTSNAAFCSGRAAGDEKAGTFPDMCSDGFDNNGDGLIDCAEPACAGAVVAPGGIKCNSPEEADCADGFDNDNNGRIDCLDPACQTGGICYAANHWIVAPQCVEVGVFSAPRFFTSNDPTVSASVYGSSRVSPASCPGDLTSCNFDRIRLAGGAGSGYASVTMIVGDNTDPDKYYPYVSSKCQLVGGGAGLTMKISGNALMIYNPGGGLASFDVTVECPTPGAPRDTRNYPVSISVLKGNGVPEFGELSFANKLYEATPPVVDKIEVEGEQPGDILRLPLNANRRFRVVSHDPNSPDPLLSSGICRCQVSIDAGAPATSNGQCEVAAPANTFVFNGDMALAATSVDGASNPSAEATRTMHVVVEPVVKTPLSLTPVPADPSVTVSVPTPFFNLRNNTLTVSVDFDTAYNGTFSDLTCGVYVYRTDGQHLNGPGPTATVPRTVVPETYRAHCEGDVTLPANLPDGQYFVAVRVQDDLQKPASRYTESNRQVLFQCEKVPDAAQSDADGDVCHWADMDHDGWAEGFYTTLFSTAPKSCDNCVNFSNPDQEDANVNGVGDICEAEGRCRVDTDTVCRMHSLTYPGPGPADQLLAAPPVPPATAPTCPGDMKCCDSSTDPLCCPEPSLKDNPLTADKAPTQACEDDWGLCSTGGEVCFIPEDCPKRGTCDSDPKIACSGAKDAAACGAENDVCNDADLCLDLMYPWPQMLYGNVFTKYLAKLPEISPQDNATFCVTGEQGVLNFRTTYKILIETENKDCVLTGATDYERPKPRNAYSTSLGRLDIDGLLNGKYGEVVNYYTQSEFMNQFPPLNGQPLGGKIYVVHGEQMGDLVIGPPPEPEQTLPPYTVPDAAAGQKGGGTVIVLSGNLYLQRDFVYDEVFQEGSLGALSQLASLGWIVLDETEPTRPNYGTKGNIYIDKSVTRLVGTFLAAGQGGVYTVAPPDTDSDKQLTVYGLMVARQFHLSRSFKSKTEGSERVIYDGRAVANPPPGFGDINKSLPVFSSSQAAQ